MFVLSSLALFVGMMCVVQLQGLARRLAPARRRTGS
jgi:hypothetical protein